MVGCHYFPPGLRSPSQLKNSDVLRPVPSYIAWWHRHIGVNNLPMVVTQLCPCVSWTHNLLITIPMSYPYTTTQACTGRVTKTWLTLLTDDQAVWHAASQWSRCMSACAAESTLPPNLCTSSHDQCTCGASLQWILFWNQHITKLSL